MLPRIQLLQLASYVCAEVKFAHIPYRLSLPPRHFPVCLVDRCLSTISSTSYPLYSEIHIVSRLS